MCGLVVTHPNRDTTVSLPCHHGPPARGASHLWLADEMSWQVSSEQDWKPRQESLLFPGSSALRWSKFPPPCMTATSGQNAFLEKGHTLSDQALLGPGLTLTFLARMGETRGAWGPRACSGAWPTPCTIALWILFLLAAGPLMPPSLLQESIAVRSQSPRQLSALTRGLILLFAAY